MNTFCTIITKSYLPYAKAVSASLRSFNLGIRLEVMVVDDRNSSKQKHEGLEVYSVDDVIANSKTGNLIFEKYHANKDVLRWALKPVFIEHLFQQGFENVIFTDPDTFYVGDYSFLFDELKTSIVLLTPHWRGRNPKTQYYNFEMQFNQGIYNAGFFGVNSKAQDVLEWWADACLYKCEKDRLTGLFDDQAYLNLVPVYFDNIKVLKHKGCNVAQWNQKECVRSAADGIVLINKKDPVVFVHFTASTIKEILNGNDTLLKPYLDKYFETLSEFGVDINALQLKAKESPGFFEWKLKALKTRFRSAVYGALK